MLFPEADFRAPIGARGGHETVFRGWSAFVSSLLVVSFVYLGQSLCGCAALSNSINYVELPPRPTVLGPEELLPKLCTNQSVICEGSFCIPGVRKCVCDLRSPVQFGRFCLRQVDINVKCFVTNQCNHTVKDAVCIDINSNAVLDRDSSKFKLEQWQNLQELKQQSQSTVTKSGSIKQASSQPLKLPTAAMLISSHSQNPLFFLNNNLDASESIIPTNNGDNVIVPSYSRNSPYEINYNTPELLAQNHTRRRTNHSDKMTPFEFLISNFSTTTQSSFISHKNDAQPNGNNQPASEATQVASTETTTPASTTTGAIFQPVLTVAPETTTLRQYFGRTPPASAITPTIPPSPDPTTARTAPTTFQTNGSGEPSSVSPTARTTGGNSRQDQSNNNDSSSNSINRNKDGETTPKRDSTSPRPDESPNERRKLVIKTPQWPPGVCACPHGFMFDAMLRKCLALSLTDSHCLSDSDCKQIDKTHCSSGSRKCECDEPLEWARSELACVPPKLITKVEGSNGDPTGQRKDLGSFFGSLIAPFIVAKLLPDYTVMLLVFVALVIIVTLILLKITVKCFSSGSSALISPTKNGKKRKHHQTGNNNFASNAYSTTSRSPYATLRRPDHKPSSQLSNFTQATRGRILNYDFEQESPRHNGSLVKSPMSPVSMGGASAKIKTEPIPAGAAAGGMTLPASHRHRHRRDSANHVDNKVEFSQPVELTDNISLSGQAESEPSKSESSVPTIPGPPPTQQPPYMLASSMRGQGSAIAAAAAAAANKRLAQKKNLEQTAKLALNKDPVFL